MKKVLVNWSGGKDASLCLHYLLQHPDYEVVGLLTLVNAEYGRVSMHGIRESLVEEQSREVGIPLHRIRIPGDLTVEAYNQLMLDTLKPFRAEGIRYCAFGDIFLEDLREYREEKLQQLDMQPLFPLWKQSTHELAKKFIDEGFRAVVASTDASKLDSSFAGREFDQVLLDQLPAQVDPCGEYGSFHSFVYDGPIFKKAVEIKRGEKVRRTYPSTSAGTSDNKQSEQCDSSETSSFWFIDLTLLSDS